MAVSSSLSSSVEMSPSCGGSPCSGELNLRTRVPPSHEVSHQSLPQSEVLSSGGRTTLMRLGDEDMEELCCFSTFPLLETVALIPKQVVKES